MSFYKVEKGPTNEIAHKHVESQTYRRRQVRLEYEKRNTLINTKMLEYQHSLLPSFGQLPVDSLAPVFVTKSTVTVRTVNYEGPRWTKISAKVVI